MSTPIGSNAVTTDAPTAARATGGAVVRATPGRAARGLTTDSRAVGPSSGFVALRGERFDGHAFVEAAVEAGATLLVVEHGKVGATDPRADVVAVDDTLAAWGALGRAHLATWRAAVPEGRVVGLTGSAGKTTTKEMIAALLRAVAPTHATAGNLNNRVGVPSVVLQVDPAHRFLVVEMGMNLPGEIAALAAIAEPDVGLVLNVGLAHAGGVGGTLADVAREKGALFAGVRSGGTRVANADDAAVMEQASRVADRRLVTFGRAEGVDVRLVAREPRAIASRVTVERRGRRASFVVPIPGDAASLDFVAALATAEACAGPLADNVVAAALAALPLIEGRMRVRSGRDVQVLDDAYNANPSSMRAALTTLGEATGRKIAVLGEMKELGPLAESEHSSLGADVAAAGVSLVISCGGLADRIAQAAAGRGVEVVCTSDATHAAAEARARVKPGDVVLVKASRSVGAERVVSALLGGEEVP